MSKSPHKNRHNAAVRSGPSLFDLIGTARTRPTVRNTDPDTAHTASAATAFTRSDKRVGEAILLALQHQPTLQWTEFEMHGIMTVSGKKWSESRIRHGRLYLQDRGMVEPTGNKRRTPAGGLTRVWTLTKAARDEAVRLNKAKGM